MKTRFRQIATVFLAACVLFSGLPFMAGDIDAHAMAKKVAKKVTLRASANGQTRANLSWNKIKKPQKGYAVFRDGHVVAHCGKKLSFSDSGLRAGTTYRYQVKVYKTKKTTKWFNKKTGKWQKRKPAKKYRGKKRNVVTYSYQKPSNTVYVKTAAKPVQASQKVNETHSRTDSSASSQPSNPSSSGSSSKPSTPASDTPSSGTITVTNYRGDICKATKLSNGQWKLETSQYGSFTVSEADLNRAFNNPLNNKTINGTFTDSYGSWYQIDGATFSTKQLNGQKADNESRRNNAFTVDIYNGDPSQLKLEIDRPVETFKTYTDERVETKASFVMKTVNGRKYRLISYFGVGEKERALANGCKVTTKTLRFGNLDHDIASCGFVDGDINITIKYKGQTIGSTVFDPNPNADSNGMHPLRAFYLGVVNDAVKTTGSYDIDMSTLDRYIYDNFENSPIDKSGVGPEYINCIGGALILETYSISRHDRYGFIAHPRTGTDHVGFFPVDTPNTYYDAQGHKVSGKEYP